LSLGKGFLDYDRFMKNCNMRAYKTSDIYFASFLITTGQFYLEGIQDQSPNKKTFIFDKEPSQDLILGFYNGSVKVSAIRLLEALQTLKSATYLVNSGSRQVEVRNQ